MTPEEYEACVRRNSQRLYLIALSFVANPTDAEDILQNVFFKLWRYQKPFHDDVHADKWLTRVCVNECKSFLASPFRKRVTSLEQCKNVYELSDDGQYDLLSAVMRLNKKERAVIHLYYYEALRVAEIAQLLHISEAAVKTRLNRARTHLKNMLGDDYNEL